MEHVSCNVMQTNVIHCNVGGARVTYIIIRQCKYKYTRIILACHALSLQDSHFVFGLYYLDYKAIQMVRQAAAAVTRYTMIIHVGG